MVFVRLPVQEVQVPFAPLLGVSVHIRVVPLAPLQVNPIQDSFVPRHPGVLVSRRCQHHRGDWVLPPKCQNGVKTLDCETPVRDRVLV